MPQAAQQSPVTLEQYAAMDMAEKRQLWIDISEIDATQFDSHIATQQAREAIVPKVGDIAPDFVADVLDRERKRTGEQVRLSDLRGQPVGLIFGSYT